MASGAELVQLETVLRDTQTSNYVLVACLTWLVYDTLLTADNEVDYLRWSEWNLTKILYLILRSHGLIALSVYAYVFTRTNLSLRFCRNFEHYGIYTISLPYYVGQAFLALRIRALYRGNRIAIRIVTGLYACETALSTAVTISEVLATRGLTPSPGSPVPGCIITGIGKSRTLGITFNVVDLLVSTVFFILIFLRFVGSDGVGARSKFRVVPAVSRFFRDASAYYLAVLAAQIFYVVLINAPVTGNSSLAIIGAPVIITTYPIATSRLIHSLRRNSGTTTTETDSSTRLELTTLFVDSASVRLSATDGEEPP